MQSAWYLTMLDVYKRQDENTAQKLSDLLLEIPQEHVRIANLIIDYAKQTLDKELSDNIYISITDHISFALERMEKGMPLKNALLWEIKKYYHSAVSYTHLFDSLHALFKQLTHLNINRIDFFSCLI